VVVPQALIVHPGVPARSAADFIALAKREPGKLTYGSAGIGTAPHMAMELLKSMAGIDVQHIPYRGVSQSVTDILGGRVSGMVLNVLTSKPHLDSGELLALGVTGSRRSEALPDVPTIAESALPRLPSAAMVWYSGTGRHARVCRQPAAGADRRRNAISGDEGALGCRRRRSRSLDAG
jgi:tripartite-type tricarboxylate transporter receptor subunit TctC